MNVRSPGADKTIWAEENSSFHTHTQNICYSHFFQRGKVFFTCFANVFFYSFFSFVFCVPKFTSIKCEIYISGKNVNKFAYLNTKITAKESGKKATIIKKKRILLCYVRWICMYEYMADTNTYESNESMEFNWQGNGERMAELADRRSGKRKNEASAVER